MQTAILSGKSKSDLKLLLELAEKLGIKSKILTDSEIEEIGLINSMNEGRTKEYVDTGSFINKLRK
jgi:hypothetical protein